jgi:site-specific DNA-cytosine methylase
MMRYPLLDLFSGYGGFSLAFEAAGFDTIGFSEIDPYASALLAHRWPTVPNLGPVQSVTRDSVFGRCGTLPAVVTGGFPCQPHSAAGKRLASADERDLWGECARVLGDIRPRVALFENVAGLLTSESGAFLNRVLSDLAAIRYACLWQVVSAADVGAPHRRERVWLLCVDELAHGNRVGHPHRPTGLVSADGRLDALGHTPAGRPAGVAHADRNGAQRQRIGLGLAREARQGGVHSSPDRFADQGRGLEWPAAHGRWPSRPGQPQHQWEPPRVVGHADRGRCEQCDTAERGVPIADAAGDAAGELAYSVSIGRDGGTDRIGRRQRESAEAQGLGTLRDDSQQAQPRLGGNTDGPPDRMDSTAQQVREAPNRTHRLKAIGNGIVPAAALPFALAIRRVLDAQALAHSHLAP